MAEQDQAKFALRQRRIYVITRLKELANELRLLREEKARLDEQFAAQSKSQKPVAPKPAASKPAAPKRK